MKKNILKYAISAIMTLSAIVMLAEVDTDGYGTRVDYLNKDGKRLSSIYVNNGRGIFNVQEYDNVFRVNSTFGEAIAKINFTPWGTEKYPITIKSSDSEVEVSYQILDDNGKVADPTMHKAGKADLLSGTGIRVFIKVPHSSYPKLDIKWEYSNYENEYSAFYNVISSGYSFSGSTCTNMFNRNYVVNVINRHSGFVQDESNTDLWYYDCFIQNEPMSFTASCVKPGKDMLRAQVNYTLTSLYCQDQSYNYNAPFPNGEPYIMTGVGDFISQDFIAGVYTISTGVEQMMDLSNFVAVNKYVTILPWTFCFKYITMSNLMLSQIESFTFATDDEKAIARAQMLVLRSHGYWRLLQMYAPRWSESNGGSTLCAPLETTFNTENQAPVSMKEIADQCYSDLDEAISIFSRVKYERQNIIEPNLDVAKGVKMRLALLREDWTTAESISNELLQTLSLTSNSELTSGFFKPAKSWIWGAWNNYDFAPAETQYNNVNNLYYYSFQNYSACNGAYPIMWNFGSNAIDKILYDSMDENDIRRTLYVMPDQVAKILPDWMNLKYTSLSDWYNSSLIDSKCFLLDDKLIKNYFANNKPIGVETPAFTTVDFNGEGSKPIVTFGAQVKFYQPGYTNFDDAAVCFMRTEEVLLTHAEAALRLGNNAAAVADLNKLNSFRISDYKQLTVNSDLMSELYKARKIELWGEGHSWFDQKRWKTPLSRRPWVDKNINSGNWPPAMVYGTLQVPVTAANGWRIMVPSAYMQNNPLVTPEILGYTDIEGYQPSTAPRKMKEIKSNEFKPSKELIKQPLHKICIE